MEYLLLIYEDENTWQERDEADRAAIMQAYYAYTKSMQEAGAYKGGNALQPTASATMVRVRRNEPSLPTSLRHRPPLELL